MALIDTHAHIHDEQFKGEVNAVLCRARTAGVSRIITVGTNVEESRVAVSFASVYEHVYATVAVHPEKYSELPDELTRRRWMESISSLAKDEKTVGIGECGLDYHVLQNIVVPEEQKQCQRQGFSDHIELARQVHKPLIVHARDSYNDVLAILSENTVDIPLIVLHCYQGDTDVTDRFLTLSDRIFFSFAGNSTYPPKKIDRNTKDDVRNVIRMIPLDRLLSETDCPYLAPQKFRGQRNEPAYVEEVVLAIAEFRGVSPESVERAIEYTARRIFPRMFF